MLGVEISAFELTLDRSHYGNCLAGSLVYEDRDPHIACKAIADLLNIGAEDRATMLEEVHGILEMLKEDAWEAGMEEGREQTRYECSEGYC